MKKSTLAKVSKFFSWGSAPSIEMLEEEARRLNPEKCECGVLIRPLTIVVGGGFKSELESKNEACHACGKMNKRYYVRY